MANAIDRAKVRAQMVTDADAFTTLRYLRHRESAPAVSDLETAGADKLPGMPAVLADVYHTLWAETPQVRNDVPSDRRYVAEMLRGAMATSAYEALHAQTALSDLKSLLGTLTMGESIVERIPEEDKEKLEQSANVEAAAQAAEAKAEAAQAGADALSDLARQPGNEGLSDEAAVAHAAAAEAKAEAEAARTEASAAAEALFGKPDSAEAQQKLQELQRIGLAAAKDAQAAVEEVSETLQSWGFEEGEFTREGMPEALATLENIRNNRAFKDFAKLLGRIKRIAARKARSKDQADGLRVTRLESGRDIRRATSREMVALTQPALRTQALTRWARGELQLRGLEQKQRKGEGPVVVCEDSSGSMDGQKQQWCKATVLALAHYAKLRKRSFVWIMFDGRVQRSKIYLHGRLTPADVLEIAEARSGGGTKFEPPLQEALRYIREEGHNKADIAFITDGDSYLGDEFLNEFNADRKALEINAFSVLADVGHISDQTVGKFSEQVLRASSFSDDDAVAVISQL
jgi:uncharacterized protein with von Willebrand factor type A (vWA) domain